jgi:dTDP-4-amino-4,6-dideoxygalactose transaminase
MSEKNEQKIGLEPIPFYRPSVSEEEIAEVVDTLRSGWLTMGPKTRLFEERFAARVGAEHAIAVNSATSGLHLGLDAMDMQPGDEVLVPTITFAATGATVIHAGATPVLVDCEPDTLNLDVEDAARKCGPRTRAVVPVHIAGHPCDMDRVAALARNRDLRVMEDAAHAIPATYRGRTIGSISELTVFSFYATKNLTTGEGGMVTTADAELADRLRMRRLHGMSRDAWKRYRSDGSWRYDVAYPGFKYNTTDVAASLGLVQLGRLDAMQARRGAIAQRYMAALRDCRELELPTVRPEVEHAWHLFIVRVNHEMLTVHRDAVIEALNAAGVGTSVHFIPLHVHSYYRDRFGYNDSRLPQASRQWERMISLPLFPGLSDADVDRVAATLVGILERHRR